MSHVKQTKCYGSCEYLTSDNTCSLNGKCSQIDIEDIILVHIVKEPAALYDIFPLTVLPATRIQENFF